MKRIIDGATYNTDTATAVAEGYVEDNDTESTLYQTRTGIYFNVDVIKTERQGRDGDIIERTNYDWTVVGDAAAARKWCENWDLTITRDIEDMPDEPKLGEKLATIYMRVTPTLKNDLDKMSDEDNVSINLWATRCLERCLNYRAHQDLKELGEIKYLSTQEPDIEWSAKTHITVLKEISQRVDLLAAKIMGDAKGLDNLIESMSFSQDFDYLNKAYPAYPNET